MVISWGVSAVLMPYSIIILKQTFDGGWSSLLLDRIFCMSQGGGDRQSLLGELWRCFSLFLNATDSGVFTARWDGGIMVVSRRSGIGAWKLKK